MKHAANVASKADFVGLQEVHGSSAEIVEFFFCKYGDDRHVSWTAFDCDEAASFDYLPICLGTAAGIASSEKSSGQVDSNRFCAAGEVARSGSIDNHDNDRDDASDLSDTSSYSYSSYNSHTSNTSHASSADASSCSASVGGVINILSKKAFPPGTSFSCHSIVQGRCLETIAEFGGTFRFLSMFNF